MKLNFIYEMALSFDTPITGQYFSLNIEPINDEAQRLYSYGCEVTPCDYYQRQRNWCGNYNYSGSAIGEHSSFGFSVRGVVFTSDNLVKAHDNVAVYKYPSHYTAVTPTMVEFLKDVPTDGSNLQVAQSVMDALHGYLTYAPSTTNIYTKAHESFALRSGVCQDYSHILIAMLRYLNVPSRYVSGLMYEDHEVRYGATHAWVEVYQDGYWHGYDPTNACRTNQGYIAFVKGRDYSDCYIDKGVFKGNATQRQCINISIKEV